MNIVKLIRTNCRIGNIFISIFIIYCTVCPSLHLCYKICMFFIIYDKSPLVVCGTDKRPVSHSYSVANCKKDGNKLAVKDFQPYIIKQNEMKHVFNSFSFDSLMFRCLFMHTTLYTYLPTFISFFFQSIFLLRFLNLNNAGGNLCICVFARINVGNCDFIYLSTYMQFYKNINIIFFFLAI